MYTHSFVKFFWLLTLLSLHLKASEQSIERRYDEQGRVIAAIDALGNETQFTYDNRGHLIEIRLPWVLDENENPVQPVQRRTYNANHQIACLEDSAGHRTFIEYGEHKQPIHISYPDGSYETFAYSAKGELIERMTNQGTLVRFVYDQEGRTISKEELTREGESIRNHTYSYKGELISSTIENGILTDFTYDSLGRKIASVTHYAEGSKRQAWRYDAEGQKVETKEWFGDAAEEYVSKISVFDPLSQTKITRLQKADGEVQVSTSHPLSTSLGTTTLQTTINQLGQTVKFEETVNSEGQRELKTYDALGRLESLVQLDRMGCRIKEYFIRYHLNGKKAKEVHHVLVNGQTTRLYEIRWTYDAMQHLTSIQEAAGSLQQKTTRFTYNRAGQLETVIKPDGTELRHTYHAKGMLASLIASDHSLAYMYSYDSDLRLSEIIDLNQNLIQTRRYNAFNELVEENFGLATLRVSKQLDLAGRKTFVTLPDGSGVRYQYDGALLTSVERLSSRPYKKHYAYAKPSGKLISINPPGWSEELIRQNNKVTAKTLCDPAGGVDYLYEYGDDQQIVREEGHVQKSYQYDSLYNRLAEDGRVWSTNELNQLEQAGNIHYRYDLNGNLCEKSVDGLITTFKYDALNRLIRANTPEGSVSYTYDAFDRQIRQQTYSASGELIKTEYLIYDDEQEIGKADEQGNLTQLRILSLGKGLEAGLAIALELDGQLLTPLYDHRGNVSCLVDKEKGAVVEYYRYTVYGIEEIYNASHQLLKVSSVGNPWRYANKRNDSLTGLINFGKRHYDPQSGRWISPDPLFFYDSPNLYAYVKNDPLNHFDPNGLFSVSDIWDYFVSFFDGYVAPAFDFLFNHMKSNYDKLNNIDSFEKVGHLILGDDLYEFGGYSSEESGSGCYGDKEINDKVRVSYVNGMLTKKSHMDSNLELISELHGGTKVHYVFRATSGWTSDITYNFKVLCLYGLFKSDHAQKIAELWRQLIAEMGGVEGGGTIIHYAHSFGGTETYRAQLELSPEERKMIRLVTFGSPTFISQEGFQQVTNHMGERDYFVRFFDMGRVGDPNYNVIIHDSPMLDHFLSGSTYRVILEQEGERFLKEFAPSYLQPLQQV